MLKQNMWEKGTGCLSEKVLKATQVLRMIIEQLFATRCGSEVRYLITRRHEMHPIASSVFVIPFLTQWFSLLWLVSRKLWHDRVLKKKTAAHENNPLGCMPRTQRKCCTVTLLTPMHGLATFCCWSHIHVQHGRTSLPENVQTSMLSLCRVLTLCLTKQHTMSNITGTWWALNEHLIPEGKMLFDIELAT